MNIIERKGKGCVIFENNGETYISLLNGAIILPRSGYPKIIDAWDDFGSLMSLNNYVTPSIDTDDGINIIRYISMGISQDEVESFTSSDLCVDVSEAVESVISMIDRRFKGKGYNKNREEVPLDIIKSELLTKINLAISKNSNLYDLEILYPLDNSSSETNIFD